MVNLSAIALAGTLFSVTDFQGHVLDESSDIPTDLNPVVGQVRAVPTSPIQQWSQSYFLATDTTAEFLMQNGNTQTFLSYAGAPSRSQTYAQAVIDGANGRAFNLLLVCLSPEKLNIVDASTLSQWCSLDNRESRTSILTCTRRFPCS
ncbi:hypothetical protein DFH06DRAFT_1191352 [Mycena polygramma]|nr:hypothetical protein DFH06DRAFT_1191352 [Mycena polygramma]